MHQPQVMPAGPSPQSVPSHLHNQLQLFSSRLPTGRLPVNTLQGLAQLNGPLAPVTGPHEMGFAQEIAKLEHIAPDMAQLPDFKVTPLRIAIELAQPSARFEISKADLVLEGPSGSQVLRNNAQGRFEVQAQPGGFKLFENGRLLGSFEGRLKVNSQAESLSINGKLFRGDLELMPDPLNPATLNVINPVLLEDYLKAVVPSESPASWPLESLKAQALAARTYAVAGWGKHAARGYDMNDDTSDQMYSGVAAEHPNTNTAVAETAGQIITYGNKPITALFFSTSGGMTDSSLEVWGTELPYIQPVKDFDQASPKYRWTTERSQRELQEAASKLGHNLGTIREITPLTHTPQGRVKTLRISGSNGSAEVDANKFRFAARLYSTLWTVDTQGSGSQRGFVFRGGGWGHALGMSQYGARQMAADGKNFREIIHHYYQGVAIETLPSGNAEPVAQPPAAPEPPASAEPPLAPTPAPMAVELPAQAAVARRWAA